MTINYQHESMPFNQIITTFHSSRNQSANLKCISYTVYDKIGLIWFTVEFNHISFTAIDITYLSQSIPSTCPMDA